MTSRWVARDDSETTPVRGGARAWAWAAAFAVACGAALPGAGCSSQPPGESVQSSAAALLGDGLVISQVYGGGGNAGAVMNHDFVELFNRSSAPVSLDGLSLQYGSSAGNFANPLSDGGIGTGITVLPAVSVAAGSYFLVSLASDGAAGAALPTPDFQGVTDLSATNGKIALVRGVTTLGCGATGNVCPLGNIVDLVGYGSATDFEGTATPALSATKSASRNGGGCIDTDENAADFTVGAPAPRSSATLPNVCEVGDAGNDGAVLPVIDASDAANDDAGSTNDDGSANDSAGPGDDGGVDEDGGEANDAEPSDDAGVPDGAPADAGTPDAGAPDAGPAPDAGSVDGGTGPYAGLVISQVFGGGGNSGAPLQSDFVELFNRSAAPLSLQGLALQYGSKAGSFGAPLSDGGPSGNIFVLPSATVAPGGYFLVALDSNAAVGAPLPTPDATGGLKLSSTDGKVALTTDAAPLGCGAANARCPQTYIVDLVGYGAATDFEGSAAAGALSNTKAALRLGNGCVDTRNNGADFAAGAPAPRSSATARVDCSAPQGGTDGGPGADAGSDSGSVQGSDGGGAGDDAGGPVGADSGGGSTSDDAGAGAGNDSGAPAAEEDGGAEDGGTSTGGGSGCSCRTAGTNTRGGSGLAALGGIALLGGAFSSRRRRSGAAQVTVANPAASRGREPFDRSGR